MFAPPDVGGAPRRVPLICSLSQRVRKKCEPNVCHLHVPKLDTIAVVTRSVDGGSVTCAICHGAIDDQRRSGGVCRVTGSADFLIRRGEEKWSSDDVLLTGTKTESIACTRRVEKGVQTIC